jgi:hypothetical protein
MKQYVIIIIAFCGMISNVLAQDVFKFREYLWGTGLDEIVRQYGKEDKEDYEPIGRKILIVDTYYNKRIYNYNSDLVFYYYGNKLIGGGYDIDSGHRIPQSRGNFSYFYNAYNDLQKLLSKDYGEPFNKKSILNINNLSMADLERWVINNRPIITVWYYKHTTITLLLAHDNNWTLVLSYSSPELNKLVNQ